MTIAGHQGHRTIRICLEHHCPADRSAGDRPARWCTHGVHLPARTAARSAARSRWKGGQRALRPILESFSNATCFGASDGTATLDVSGGSGSHDVWNTLHRRWATAGRLAPGMYTATVSDDSRCDTQEVPLTIAGPASPIPSTFSVSDHNGFPISCAGAEDGAVDLTISGGQSPTAGSGRYSGQPDRH